MAGEQCLSLLEGAGQSLLYKSAGVYSLCINLSLMAAENHKREQLGMRRRQKSNGRVSAPAADTPRGEGPLAVKHDCERCGGVTAAARQQRSSRSGAALRRYVLHSSSSCRCTGRTEAVRWAASARISPVMHKAPRRTRQPGVPWLRQAGPCSCPLGLLFLFPPPVSSSASHSCAGRPQLRGPSKAARGK